jgi:hypothetical protein
MPKPPAKPPAPCLPPRWECCRGPLVDGDYAHTRACNLGYWASNALVVAMVAVPFVTTALAFFLLTD